MKRFAPILGAADKVQRGFRYSPFACQKIDDGRINLSCAGGPTVVVNLSDFRPGGIVTVDITCATRNGDLAAVAPPSKQFTGRGAAVVDTYRAGTP